MVIASLVKESLILLRRAMYNFIEKIAKISTYIILVFKKNPGPTMPPSLFRKPIDESEVKPF